MWMNILLKVDLSEILVSGYPIGFGIGGTSAGIAGAIS